MSRRAFLLLLLSACSQPQAAYSPPTLVPPTPTVGPTPGPTAITPAGETIRFAIVGDYGYDSKGEQRVAALIRGFTPDFVLTVGDNNYPDGDPSTLDTNVGKYYHDFIGNYRGEHGSGAEVNRFFPTIGNHDIGEDVNATYAAYLEYFDLPGNEMYYEVAGGPVRCFALDTHLAADQHFAPDSEQGVWLKQALAAATEPWKIVFMHYPPYSSTEYEVPRMRWPFREWGASVVITGHAHVYERLDVDGFLYLVNGLGGRNKQEFVAPVPGSVLRYNADFGAMLVTATASTLRLRFITWRKETIDDVQLHVS